VALSQALLLKLSKRYALSSMVDMKFRGKDLSFKTDEQGNPVVLFIGKALPDGSIKGERYARRLLRNAEGLLIKDHWDLKGKA